MKVKLTRNVLIGGKPYPFGWTGELPDSQAKTLVVIGKAVSLDPPPKTSAIGQPK